MKLSTANTLGRQPWGSSLCRKANSSMASGWWYGNSAATISAHGEILTLRPNTIVHVVVYRYE